MVLMRTHVTLKVALNVKQLCINNDLVIHRQVKTNDIIFRRFGDLMTPLSRIKMKITKCVFKGL